MEKIKDDHIFFSNECRQLGMSVLCCCYYFWILLNARIRGKTKKIETIIRPMKGKATDEREQSVHLFLVCLAFRYRNTRTSAFVETFGP